MKKLLMIPLMVVGFMTMSFSENSVDVYEENNPPGWTCGWDDGFAYHTIVHNGSTGITRRWITTAGGHQSSSVITEGEGLVLCQMHMQ